MNTSGDAAEQVVRLSIEGTEFAIKIAGKGAKEIGIFLIAALQGAKRTKGKTRLAGLLKSGKELKVFSLPENELKKFAEEAKKYGVLYAALKGVKRSEDGMVDIMCRAEDASKINRIFERFSIAAIDTAEIRNDVIRSAEERAAQSRYLPEQTQESVTADEKQNPTKEKSRSDNPTTLFQPKTKQQNPTQARSERSPQYEPSSRNSSQSGRAGSFEDTRNKPSVRQQMADIRASRDNRNDTGRDSRQTSHKSTTKQKHSKPKGR